MLLTSNVSFLAIQSLDNLGFVGYRSPAQRVSYLSIALSIGTIVLGLSLSRQYHTTLEVCSLLRVLTPLSHSL